jgi:predicted nucleotidyltransferase component of viral defense system
VICFPKLIMPRPVFVEKDYWIVYVSKHLAASEFTDKVIFKGGPSLFKAYQFNAFKGFRRI